MLQNIHLGASVSLLFRLQVLALTVLAWVVIYFIVNRRPVDSQRRLDAGTDLDRKIPFTPQMALVYFSTYPFIFLPFFILDQAQQFYWMLANFIFISLVSCLFHAFLPSKVERVVNVDTSGINGKMIHWFQCLCQPHGNFPSMHVALSVPVVGAAFMVAGPFVGSLTLAWAVLIALSTLYTKQHYIWDVLAGGGIGALVFSLTYWLML